MKIINSKKIKNIFKIQPTIFSDNRGSFSEVFKQEFFDSINFIQENESLNLKPGTIRGLHLQSGDYSQSKLVKVSNGKILDVVVDLRKNSSTFGKWESFILDSISKESLFIPKGFAHGFITLEENTIVTYKIDNSYNPSSEICIKFDDKDLNIDWQWNGLFIQSDKDQKSSISFERYIREFN